VEKLYAKYEENERKDVEACFRTIDDIRPKAVQLFTTDPVKDLSANKTASKSQPKQTTAPQRFYSTIDVKARSFKPSLPKTLATN
jgi:hypothetical protein